MRGPTGERARRSRAAPWLLAAAALALLAGACGDDDGDDAVDTTEAADGADGAAAGDGAAEEPVEITGVDYTYEGLPDTVAAGTELALTNGADDEVHEIVLLRVDDDEDRPLDELLALPEAEQQEVASFQGVSVALPGEDGEVVEGSLTVDEPGRYLLICTIPQGADPDAYREALSSGAPEEPEVEGGPPHLVLGMAAELEVEG